MLSVIVVRTFKIALVLFLLLGWYILSLCGKSTQISRSEGGNYRQLVTTSAELLPPNQWGFQTVDMFRCGFQDSGRYIQRDWLFVRITRKIGH